MSCTVCNHPERQAIDEALLARTATLAQLSQQHHLSTSALHRHKQHLQKKMPQVSSRFQDLLSEGCLVILNSFLELIIRTARTADAEGNSRLVLQAVRQGTAILKFMHKLDFPSLRTPSTVCSPPPNGPTRTACCPPTQNFYSAPARPWPTVSSASCPEPALTRIKLLRQTWGIWLPWMTLPI